jgi:predicted ATPase
MRLVSAEFQNFKSLENVTLHFRDLTIIVGANATGKSNCLEVLRLSNAIVTAATPPPIKFLNEPLRNKDLPLKLLIKVEFESGKLGQYYISIDKKDGRFIFSREKLTIENIDVIDIIDSIGTVSDEDGHNRQKYDSKEGALALKTAGNFGNRSLTAEMSEFVRNWEFYNFEPHRMRNKGSKYYISELIENMTDKIPVMDIDGEFIEQVLSYHGDQGDDIFNEISREVESCLRIKIEYNPNDKPKIKIIEQDNKSVSISSLSDGTLRIIGYCVLLHKNTVPSLISIEEPEQNLHPAILQNVADLLKRLSLRTQVVITTHSSQLLDCFTLDDITEDISVLLLSKSDSHGTQIYQLDKLSEDREALADWMRNFGVGSAIYHSNLLEQICEPQYA